MLNNYKLQGGKDMTLRQILGGILLFVSLYAMYKIARRPRD